MEKIIDGVPLPPDTAPASTMASPADIDPDLLGVWVGAWGSVMKHILIIESVAENGDATVIYAHGANPWLEIAPAWSRSAATIADGAIHVRLKSTDAHYRLSAKGTLKAVYGDGLSHAVMRREEWETISLPGAEISWSGGRSERLPTKLIEDGKTVDLEIVLFRPEGDGPFPLAVVNHGSTGRGDAPDLFVETWVDAGLADYLVNAGWLVAFPQRRGRGRSDGLYDEGFEIDRTRGYTCDPTRSLAGADRALEDIEAAIEALLQRPDVLDGPILMAGQSRGGALSIAYAGRHPGQLSGVLNFVGGWIGEDCETASIVNGALFEAGGRFKGPTLSIYGEDDMFYSMPHCRENFAIFQASGGRGTFVAVSVPGKQNGHAVMAYTPLWQKSVGTFLAEMVLVRRRGK